MTERLHGFFNRDHNAVQLEVAALLPVGVIGTDRCAFTWVDVEMQSGQSLLYVGGHSAGIIGGPCQKMVRSSA